MSTRPTAKPRPGLPASREQSRWERRPLPAQFESDLVTIPEPISYTDRNPYSNAFNHTHAISHAHDGPISHTHTFRDPGADSGTDPHCNCFPVPDSTVDTSTD